MPAKERFKTKYPGVFFIMGKTVATDEAEKIFYIFYRKAGRQIEEKVGRQFQDAMTPAKAAQIRAERINRKELANRERRESERAKKIAEDTRPTFGKLFSVYQNSNPARNWATDTSLYRLYLSKFFDEKTPAEVVTLDIDRVRHQMLKAKKSPQTTKHALALLRRIIRFGVKKGYLPAAEAVHLHFELPSVDNEKTETLTPEQIAALFRALDAEADQNMAGLIRLALATGMRKGALLGLRWADCDFPRGFITLRGESAKSKKTARIPMSNAARAILENTPRLSSDFCFPGRGGGKRFDVQCMTRRIKLTAGLPKDFRVLHGLRHVFASLLASSGLVDMYALQKLLTHGSQKMTARYSHLSDESLQRAAAVGADILNEIIDAPKPAAKVVDITHGRR